MRLSVGEIRIAIEHLQVEPFPFAIQTGKEFVELLAQIQITLVAFCNRPTNVYHHLAFQKHKKSGLDSWLIIQSNDAHAGTEAHA